MITPVNHDLLTTMLATPQSHQLESDMYAAGCSNIPSQSKQTRSLCRGLRFETREALPTYILGWVIAFHALQKPRVRVCFLMDAEPCFGTASFICRGHVSRLVLKICCGLPQRSLWVLCWPPSGIHEDEYQPTCHCWHMHGVA